MGKLPILVKLLSYLRKPRQIILVAVGVLFLLGSLIVESQLSVQENEFLLEIYNGLVEEFQLP